MKQTISMNVKITFSTSLYICFIVNWHHSNKVLYFTDIILKLFITIFHVGEDLESSSRSSKVCSC